MVMQQPENQAQVHYEEPFNKTRISLGVSAIALVLFICIIVMAIAPGGDLAMAIAVILLIALWTFNIMFVFATSPSVGVPTRGIIRELDGSTQTVYTVRPLLGRRKCEQIGGLRMSKFHGYVVDYNAPYVLYTCFGKSFRVRWQPALLAVNW